MTADAGGELGAADAHEAVDYSQYSEILRRRPGPKPVTQGPVPHRQVDQHAAVDMWDALHARCFSLPDVTEHESLVVDAPGAKALWLDAAVAIGPEDAFIAEREFAHMHARPDSSLHLQLPAELAALAVDGGWAELHTLVWLGFTGPQALMIFAPRDEDELDVVWSLVVESYRYARSEPPLIAFEPRPVRAGGE